MAAAVATVVTEKADGGVAEGKVKSSEDTEDVAVSLAK